MFYPAYREGGGPIEAKPFYIASATAITKGSFVKYTTGTGIEASAGTDFDDPCLGVAAEDHDGSTAGRESGYEILVYCDPDIIYYNVPKTLSTVDSGDATSWVDAEFTAADDVFNGGHIVVVNPNSVTGFAAGDVLTISDFANTGGDFTVAGAGGTIAAGITGYVYPGKLAVNSHAFDTDSGIDDLDLKTAGGETLVITDVVWDGKKKEATVYVKIRLHQFGNSTVAL